jgi:ABC-2 type transport system ATP-binding protein
MIEVSNLVKRFGQTVAVDDVSFSVARGEVLGFLGPNGAGKTTTMRILTCYLVADSGTATVAGYDINENPIEVRRRVGYLPETAPLYNDMTVIDYLDFVAEARGIRNGGRKAAVDRMIDVTSLEGVTRQSIGSLSRGYRQRVGLAQTLIHDPDILILDEPTSGLDPNQIIGIRQLIKKLGEEKTILLSTHILPEVSATCSRMIIIDRGKLVASGTPEELSSQASQHGSTLVTIRGPLRDIATALTQTPWISEWQEIGARTGDLHRLRVEGSEGRDISEDLFRIVAEKGWSLTELCRQEMSLEEVFLRLTMSEREKPAPDVGSEVNPH